ncbi:MAG: DMT family transporter [Clostridiales bacterium]|nr:DMT family transporter [Clostridiales bacterium]
MQISKKQNLSGKIMLLTATIIWGSSFFVLKNAIDSFPTFYVLGIRFALAVGLLGLIFFNRVITLNKTTVKKGVVLGVFLAAAYSLQTIGLKYSTPAKNAFLTATYCIVVPFLSWIIFRKKANSYNIVAAAMCLVGIGLVSLTNDLRLGFGEILTIISGVFFACQLIAISRFGQHEDMIQLLMVELLFAMLIFFGISFISESQRYVIKLSFRDILPILYLSVFATALTQVLQMKGQRYTTANEASLILCLEAVFGTLFSIIFYKEVMTLRLYIGFAIIFVALVISETKLEFLTKGIEKLKIKRQNNKRR